MRRRMDAPNPHGSFLEWFKKAAVAIEIFPQSDRYDLWISNGYTVEEGWNGAFIASIPNLDDAKLIALGLKVLREQLVNVNIDEFLRPWEQESIRQFRELLEDSSLGNPEANAMRGQTSDETARQIMEYANEKAGSRPLGNFTICFLCGSVVSNEHVTKREHKFRILWVCPDCIYATLCERNPTGIHSEILDDDESGQIGHCINCGLQFKWSGIEYKWKEKR